MLVCHSGEHSCEAIQPSELDTTEVKKTFKENPKMTPSQFSTLKIASLIRGKVDWDMPDKDAANLLDRKLISNLKPAASKESESNKNDFLNVKDFKAHCDKRDVYYVYKINNRELNPSQPNYVFKTSRTKIKIALNSIESKQWTSCVRKRGMLFRWKRIETAQ